jgi:hypothetical protein
MSNDLSIDQIIGYQIQSTTEWRRQEAMTCATQKQRMYSIGLPRKYHASKGPKSISGCFSYMP